MRDIRIQDAILSRAVQTYHGKKMEKDQYFSIKQCYIQKTMQ
jgi:hypothetical protein